MNPVCRVSTESREKLVILEKMAHEERRVVLVWKKSSCMYSTNILHDHLARKASGVLKAREAVRVCPARKAHLDDLAHRASEDHQVVLSFLIKTNLQVD